MSLDQIILLKWQWLLLLPLLLGYLIWWFSKKRTANISASMVDIDASAHNHFYHPLAHKLIEEAKQRPVISYPFWKQHRFWLFSAIASLLLISLAQPVLIGKRLPDPPPERDIIFLIDVSVSMQLKDYQQDGVAIKRIDVLRNLLDEFALKMKGEKISLILFAEKAYVLVPLTSDQNLIRKMLRRITSSLAGRFTALGDALLMALNQSKQAQKGKEKKRHQTFILFTDADASRGKVTSSAAAEIVAEEEIPVFTIAIGSSQQDGKKKIEGGMYHPVDPALLADISKRTDGKSYQVNDANAMQKALQEILQQRQNIAIPKPQYEQQSLYFYPLLLALFLLFLSQLLSLVKQMRQRHV